MGTQGGCEVTGESSENPESIIYEKGVNTALSENLFSF